MKKPILYLFAISHYCEKARWALDFSGIDYEVKYLAPGAHMVVAKNMGAQTSSLPILRVSDKVIQGSSAIIDWAENQSSNGRSLAPTTAQDSDQEMERRLDDRLGVHARRYYYSEALVKYPDTVRSIFFQDLTLMQKILFSSSWKLVRRKMIERMDLGSEQGLASKAIVEVELDWLDSRLSDDQNQNKHKDFLLGDRLSRVDIAAASLLAPLVLPPEHPAYAKLAIPPQLGEDLLAWNERVSFNWVRSIYKNYR